MILIIMRSLIYIVGGIISYRARLYSLSFHLFISIIVAFAKAIDIGYYYEAIMIVYALSVVWIVADIHNGNIRGKEQ